MYVCQGLASITLGQLYCKSLAPCRWCYQSTIWEIVGFRQEFGSAFESTLTILINFFAAEVYYRGSFIKL